METIISQRQPSNRLHVSSERNKGQEPKSLLNINQKANERQRIPKLKVNPEFKGNPVFRDKVRQRGLELNSKSLSHVDVSIYKKVYQY